MNKEKLKQKSKEQVTKPSVLTWNLEELKQKLSEVEI